MPFSGAGSVIAMPDTPPAPSALEIVLMDVVAMARNPFTGQQLTQDWNAGWKELSVTVPPLNDAEAQPWLAFLAALKGTRNVFQFHTAVCAAYPLTLQGGSPPTPLYWRLKTNERKYTIDPDRYYRIQFEVIEAF
jgi:hypothetical protein